MEILNNPIIKEKIGSQKIFDLSYNNDRLGIILPIEENPIKKLEELFNKIVCDDKVSFGHYQLQNLFTLAQSIECDVVVNLLVSAIDKKMSLFKDAISDENGVITSIELPKYIQIWESFRSFSDKMYQIIKNYQQYLVRRDVTIGKIEYDILSVLQICMFYNSILRGSEQLIDKISEDLYDIDHQNIEQLINYVDSLRTFMLMKDFTTINREKLSNVISSIINKTSIINVLCAHMHSLLKNLVGKNLPLDYETTTIADGERKIIKKIYKIATILSSYADKPKLLACYRKFMQVRIVDLKYDNLELEIELVKRLSGKLGKEDSQKMVDSIADIINSKNANNVIHTADIKIKSEEYKKIKAVNASTLNPIILTKNVWKIYNVTDMEPVFPLEMKCYLDIISKSYLNIHQGKYVIEWQPTLGSAKFEAQLGSKKVLITCNILQAMALMYMNNRPCLTTEQFAKDVVINVELANKILESLFEANIITYVSSDQKEYIINVKNYTGDNQIDIRHNFVEVFEMEISGDENEMINTEEIIDESENTVVRLQSTSYRDFVSKRINEIKEKFPNMGHRDCMIKVTKEWNKYKHTITKTKKYPTTEKSIPEVVLKVVSQPLDSSSESSESSSESSESDSDSETSPVKKVSKSSYSSSEEEKPKKKSPVKTSPPASSKKVPPKKIIPDEIDFLSESDELLVS